MVQPSDAKFSAGLCVEELVRSGFVVVPRMMTGDLLDEVTRAYDTAMEDGSGPGFRVGSTTTRTSDLLRSRVMHEVYRAHDLVQVCGGFFGERFRLSSMVGRTVRAGVPAQELHADLERGSGDAPLLGFILMIDSFREENGATRFVPGSHTWRDVPAERRADNREPFAGEVLACGERGTMIVFNGAVWHGHTANRVGEARRSIQGYFVRRGVRPRKDASRFLEDGVRLGIGLSGLSLLEGG